MITALWLLIAQGVLGAFDTLYYHELRARLRARGAVAGRELKLHAARDFLYALLFATLPRLEWHGAWTVVLVAVFGAEIVITMTDFVIEAYDRKSFGDVEPGERVTHAVMGICYGAMLALLVPALTRWASLPTGFLANNAPPIVSAVLTLMAIGVFLSGVRDLAAVYVPVTRWPWRVA